MMTRTLGGVVRDARARLGISQGELADRAGVTRSWLSRVETDRVDRPRREWLEQMEIVLDLAHGTLVAAAGYRTTVLPTPTPRFSDEVAKFLHRVREWERKHRNDNDTPFLSGLA